MNSINELIVVTEVQSTPEGTVIIGDDVVLERTTSGTLQEWRPETIDVSEGIELIDEDHEFIVPDMKNQDDNYDHLVEAPLVDGLDSGSEVEDDELIIELQDIMVESDEEQAEVEEEVGGPATDYDWSDNYCTFNGVRENFEEDSGPKIEGTSPLSLFTQLWDQTLMQSIVKETNSYAWDYIAKSHEREAGLPAQSRVQDWKETSVSELYRLVAVMILMSMCVRGRLDEYWRAGLLSMPDFKKVMSKNRFLLLMKFLHFVDNYAICSHGAERKLAKVKPIVDYLNQKFQASYTPRREVSIDESLLLWKGNLSWIQYIRTKAARVGIKSYELCEAVSGYVLNLIVYTGKDTVPTESTFGFISSTAKVVLKLFKDYLGKGYTLYMDNFYNSVRLTRFLKSRRTDVVGTLNRRRVDTPADIQNLIERRLPRGTIVSRHCGDVSVTSWKDVKLVTTVSTFHDAELVERRRASGVRLLKPVVVDNYNKFMGGVDLKDHKLSTYLMERKRGLKWYIKVFRRLLNITILNAYIIYTSNIGQQRKMTHRQFRYKLAEELIEQYGVVLKTRQRHGNPCSRLNRNLDHFPEHSEVTEDRLPKQDRFKRRRCVMCTSLKRQTKTNVICSQCKVFLCIGHWSMLEGFPHP